jgi:hypothetical protein
MNRYAICVDAGYLYAQGSVALAGVKQRRELLVLEPSKVIEELRRVAAGKIRTQRLFGGGTATDLLRVYWYDGALGSRPTLEQEKLAHLDNVKLRLGFINSVGQQKGVDSLIVTDLIELARLGACGFRRIRPGIPSEVGHRFRSKPAGDSDDPGHPGGAALASAWTSGQAAG